MPSGDQDRDELRESIIEHLPEVVLVLDEDAVITFASGTFPPTVPLDVGGLVGRNAWELVHPGELIDATAALFQSEHYFDQPVGPMQIRYFDDNGEVRYAEAVGMNCLKDPAISGFVVLLRDIVGPAAVEQAIDAIARGEALPVVATHVLRATEQNPFAGAGWVLRLADDPSSDDVTVVAATPKLSGLEELVAQPAGWLDQLRAGATVIDHDLTTVPEALADALRQRGLVSLTAVPVQPPSHAAPPLVIVVVDPWGEPANANQLRHLHRFATVLSIAFERPTG